MTVYRLNPLQDPRWPELVDWHPRASVFHSVGWLEALHRTYGFEPVAFTTSDPETGLQNAMTFCEVRSWLTGRRLVSLPFADHCDALAEDAGQLEEMWNHVTAERSRYRWRYIEVRPTSRAFTPRVGLCEGSRFCLHTLDLRPDPVVLFQSFNKDSIQRKIRRAEREQLDHEEGRTDELLRAFYRLVVLTRQRHPLPPQPLVWFRNLVDCLGQALTIRIASRAGQPIAGIVTLRHKNTITYRSVRRTPIFTTWAECSSCSGRPSWRRGRRVVSRSTWDDPTTNKRVWSPSRIAGALRNLPSDTGNIRKVNRHGAG